MKIVEFITRMLEARGAEEKVLNTVPLFIQRAVVKLQRRDLFPPSTLRFNPNEKIETEVRGDGSVAYQYITLPDDFRELNKFDVEGTRYFWHNNVFDIKNQSVRRNQPLFTISEEQDITGTRKHRLVLQPFPKPDQLITVFYYIDGSEESFQRITQDYWDPILTTIETDLGLRSEESSNSEIADVVNQNKHREGFGEFNKTIKRTKPSFFASKRYR